MNKNLELREEEAKKIVKSKIKQIEILTGDTKKASKFGSALVQLSQNKNLVECSVESIIDVGFQIVQAGLNPNPLFGQAYVVPFKIKGKNGKTKFTVAQLQIGYKGYIQLGYRAGWRFKAVPVFKCDDFSIEFGGFEDVISLKPNYDERQEDNGAWVFENLSGVIVYAKDKDKYISTEFVPFKKLEQLRLQSQNQIREKLLYIWESWAVEMYSAKAIKYVVSRLPIEDEIKEVILEEDKVYQINTKDDINLNSIDINDIQNKSIEDKKEASAKRIIDIEIPDKSPTKQIKEILVNKYSISEEKAQNWCLNNKEQIQSYLNDPASIETIAVEIIGL